MTTTERVPLLNSSDYSPPVVSLDTSAYDSSPSLTIRHSLNNEGDKLDYRTFTGFYILMSCLFVLEPANRALRPVWRIFQFFMLLICVSGCVITVVLLEIQYPWQTVSEVLSLLQVVNAYIFLIIYLRKPHFKRLLYVAYQKDSNRIFKLVNRYILLYVLFTIITMGASTFQILEWLKELSFLQQPTHVLSVIMLALGKLLNISIGFAALITFWIVLHLTRSQWKEFVIKLSRNEFATASDALHRHATLTSQLSSTNQSYEYYLVVTVTVLVSTILSSLYSSLKGQADDESLYVWLLSFIVNCLFMAAITFPASIVTTQCRKVMKKVNQMRALCSATDEKRIREIDSFLVYLLTNNASCKIAGVPIDLGFATKLCITLFTVAAFMVTRELSPTPSS